LTGKKKRLAQESVEWKLVFTNQALKDARKLKNSGLKPAAEKLLTVLKRDPFQTLPRFEKLVGDLSGAYSRRINIQHRLVYQVLEDLRIVKVIRMWTQYE
jgi:toxin YoeB